MKKLMNKINMAAICILTSGPAMAVVNESGICQLIEQMHSVLNILRTFVFVGAAFTIAGWAWGFITAGKGDDLIKDLKSKGIGMLVGFIILFSIGLILSFLLSTSGQQSMGCNNMMLSW